MQIEGSIKDDAFPGKFLEMFQYAEIIWIHAVRDFLGAPGEIVRMYSSRECRAFFRARIEGHNHVGRRHRLGLQEVFIASLFQNRWGKWHPEIAAFDHFIDRANGIVMGGIREDGAVPQHTELAASFVSRNNVAVAQQLGDLFFNIVFLLDHHGAMRLLVTKCLLDPLRAVFHSKIEIV